VFETLFELLFKYRPLVFRQGDFVLASPWSLLLISVVIVVGTAVTLSTYARARGKSTPVDRNILSALRLMALATVVFCLFRPVLVLSSIVPQQNFLGILIDNSRSMEIADRDNEPRHTFVDRNFESETSRLRAALADRFALRFFKFSSATERLTDLNELDYEGTRTDLGSALNRARDELSGVPLSGLVVVSDGADNSESVLTESLRGLSTDGIPVYTVGLGHEAFERDIQLSRVEMPRSVLQGTSLVIDVVIGQVGYSGTSIVIQAEDEGRLVSTEDVQLPANGEPATVRMRLTATETGPRIFRFSVPVQAGEMVTQNNVREVLIVVEDRREKILYFEGEPRFEVKFVRRAVADDENLQVVVLQRTADNKYLRLDVDDADTLVGGFPKTREELFQYRGLILGSIEARYFTPDQLRMIASFVNQRGGGFLMLGGRSAFAEGGYVGTPIADILPVVLGEPLLIDGEPAFTEITVSPTRAGQTHPVMQVDDTEEASAERWKNLPAVSSLNPIFETKPGATTLLTGTSESDERIVLAFQRYGAGKTLALPIQDSWMWQMHADVAPDDMTHELFWRRLLRWLVDGVPDQVVASVRRDHVEPGEPIELLTEVVDGTYLRMNNSQVIAEMTSPSGDFVEIPLDWTTEHDGEYKGHITPTEEGLYRIRVEATNNDNLVGTDMAYFFASASDDEFFDSAMRAPLLRRIADETSGQFYTVDTVESLPEDIAYTGAGVTIVEELELWDMPILLLLLIVLVGSEWGYRRIRGLS
ncbi:uncharacterized protein METZ01_LOCUS22756, partial [marine metagenome]|tara:strand:+ start:686 stop:2971 length:2286 start_codon:yes stop_codon:yes gene_type:complete